ncbi:hypothetical protein JP75_14235 [Devosia riboflavina]|jgi:hypothetical protein|uniref:Uncharacterized protein n=1 Tax=Devosia riboflavina TaxID=46914 RepID=A0A087M177_9HYPH|nr:hypothetical protein [Devosia riboflavina]KFL30630.1 hypothetical protein JP75_14235 [Devosia riboflavina]
MLDVDVTRPPTSFAGFQAAPTQCRRRTLRHAVETLVLVHPSIKRLADDDALDELADDLMIGPDDFTTVKVDYSGRVIHLACVCNSAWRGDRKGGFLELKALAALAGHTVVLVPEAFIRREPRLSNSLMIAGAAGAEIGLTDRMKILALLLDNGGSAPLLDLAAMVRGDEPVAAIMALVIEGGLYVDLNKRILPSTEVHLVQPL